MQFLAHSPERSKLMKLHRSACTTRSVSRIIALRAKRRAPGEDAAPRENPGKTLPAVSVNERRAQRIARERDDSYSHFQNTIAFANAGLLGGASRQNRAYVLQRRVQLAVDAPQLSTFADLAAYVEPEARLRFVNCHAPRPLPDRVLIRSGSRRMLRHAPVIVHHCHGRRASRTAVLVRGW